MSTFSPAQVEQLLKPIHSSRVLSDGKGHAHVSQQDILAHLIRVFGFGAFDVEVLAVECIFEQGRNGTPEVPPNRFDVCYRALVRLTIRNQAGERVASYENGSTATAQNQTRGDAHDLAYKSAISLSVKRAAIALGDQFGLSLYNKGQRDALVRGTLVGGATAHDGRDMQAGIPQQVSLGNDEVDLPLEHPSASSAGEPPAAPPAGREAAPPPPAEDSPMTAETRGAMFAQFGKKGIADSEQLERINRLLGTDYTSRGQLTEAHARKVINAVKKLPNAPAEVTP